MTGSKWSGISSPTTKNWRDGSPRIKTVVDRISSQVSASAAEMGRTVSAAGVGAQGMFNYADDEWEPFP